MTALFRLLAGGVRAAPTGTAAAAPQTLAADLDVTLQLTPPTPQIAGASGPSE